MGTSIGKGDYMTESECVSEGGRERAKRQGVEIKRVNKRAREKVRK